jgi:hypothetical protein
MAHELSTHEEIFHMYMFCDLKHHTALSLTHTHTLPSPTNFSRSLGVIAKLSRTHNLVQGVYNTPAGDEVRVKGFQNNKF